MNKFGLIGFPLGHSFSKKYFTNKFETEEINNAVYNNYPLESIEQFIQLKQTENLKGLNVTIPYKETVISFLDELDTNAQNIGAVNTITFKNGKAKGFNTDIYGFENSLKPLLKPNHKKALILGTGGASKAVKFVFKKLNIEYLFVSRTPEANQINYTQINQTLLEEYTVIINTTPLGTFPNIEQSPDIPYHFLNEKHLLFDLVYNPEITKFMQHGLDNCATVKNGYEMLVLQAERAWQIWNG